MNSEQERIYGIAEKQAETSRKFGRQARQECSAEEAIEVLADYIRLADEHEQTKDRWIEGEEKLAYCKTEIQSLYGRVGAAARANNDLKKLNNKLVGTGIAEAKIIEQLTKMVDNQSDTIVELTLQLDTRDVQ